MEPMSERTGKKRDVMLSTPIAVKFTSVYHLLTCNSVSLFRHVAEVVNIPHSPLKAVRNMLLA